MGDRNKPNLDRPPGQVDNQIPLKLVWQRTLRQHGAAECNQSCPSLCNRPRPDTVLSALSCQIPSHRSQSESDCHGQPEKHKIGLLI